jgi:formate hydrogenlyase subunit 6/NADH:ubiquinone oxidoreductase subunit I
MAFNVIGKTVIRSLFGKPATAMYPVVKKEFYPRSRGSIEVNPETCIYCNICAKRCPTDAITVARAERTWTIDRMRCLVCNFCVEVCPKDCLSTGREYTSPMVDKELRLVQVSGPPAEPKPQEAKPQETTQAVKPQDA